MEVRNVRWVGVHTREYERRSIQVWAPGGNLHEFASRPP